MALLSDQSAIQLDSGLQKERTERTSQSCTSGLWLLICTSDLADNLSRLKTTSNYLAQNDI